MTVSTASISCGAVSVNSPASSDLSAAFARARDRVCSPRTTAGLRPREVGPRRRPPGDESCRCNAHPGPEVQHDLVTPLSRQRLCETRRVAEPLDTVAVNRVFHDHECAYYDERFAIRHDYWAGRRARREVEQALGR